MICREMRDRSDQVSSRLSNRASVVRADLVVDVGDVHDEIDLVAKEVSEDAAHDILRHVVPVV